MTAELYLEGVQAAIFHHYPNMTKRPDIVRLGDGTLWRFYRFCKPKGGADFAALYRRATVDEFPLLHLNKVPCGYSEPESDYRDPDTGKHRTARCEGGKLIVRGTGQDSVTDGDMFISRRPCPKCDSI